ncbi:MAG: hypothetical protein GF329_20620 [Candidatus Lokiarchaeota archaeon]|nr:hypothetical protein [Candidatus Lokiarchaeota archaeon]
MFFMIECIIDCDPGIDDAIALILASRISDLDIKAITTVFGNSPLQNTSINALKILELINCRIPVAKGCGNPIIKDLRLSQKLDKTISPHGSDGLANNNLPKPLIELKEIHAVDLIEKKIAQHPGKLTLIFLGPLTNLALLILKNLQIISKIHEVIIMGGAIRVGGNVTKYSEFNIWADAEAAKIVFNHIKDKIILVPLDVTTKVVFKELEIFDKEGEYFQFIHGILKYYSNFHLKYRGFYGSTLHDPLAVGIAHDRSLAKIEKLPIDIEIENKEKYGKTFLMDDVLQDPGFINVCSSISDNQKERFLDLFIKKLSEK